MKSDGIFFDDKDFQKSIKEKMGIMEKGGLVQKFVDSEVLRLMAPYTPMDTGALIQSAINGTVIGSGKIEYVSPYARYLYYGEIYGPNIPIKENGQIVGYWSPAKKSPTGRPLTYSKEKHQLAGKLWFERMKSDHKEDILKGAMALAMGRTNKN